jgi:hypothetical protein
VRKGQKEYNQKKFPKYWCLFGTKLSTIECCEWECDTILSGDSGRSTPLQHKLTDDLVRTISELGIVGIITMLVTLVLAVFWLLLPFIVWAVQRSTSHCRRELRALNSKLEQVLSKIEVASKASTDVSHLDTIHSTTTNGQVP